MFSYEILEIFKNTFFYGKTPVNAAGQEDDLTGPAAAFLSVSFKGTVTQIT